MVFKTVTLSYLLIFVGILSGIYIKHRRHQRFPTLVAPLLTAALLMGLLFFFDIFF